MPGPLQQTGGHQDSEAAGSRPPSTPARLDLASLADDPMFVLLDAMVSGSDEKVADALRSVGIKLLTTTRRPLLATTLQMLPADLVRLDPTLLALEAMLCRLDGRYDDAIRLAIAAQRVVDDTSPELLDPDTVDWVALLMLWRSRCGWADPHEAVARVRSRLGCRHGLSKIHTLGPGASTEWSSWLMGELAAVQMLTGDLDEAALHLDEMIGNARKLGNDRLLSTGLAQRSLLELVDGAYQTAASSAHGSLELVDGEGSASLPHLACAHLVIGWSAVQELDLVSARVHLAAAEAETPLALDPLLTEIARLLHVRLMAMGGSPADARRLLAEHHPPPSSEPAFLQRLSLVTAAQVASMSGDVSGIRDRVVGLAQLGYLDEADLFEAVVETDVGRGSAALTIVDRLLARPRLHPTVGAGAAALRVGLLLRARQVPKAAALLPDLQNRVAPQRMLLLMSIASLGGPDFPRLLEAEARRRDGHPFAADALEILGGRPTRSGLAPGEGVETDGSARLTPREREVLAELALGGSYADVAAALFLSENTVKTHLASTYRKLGVDRRVDALRIARENHVL